jgi:hypothetical protein
MLLSSRLVIVPMIFAGVPERHRCRKCGGRDAALQGEASEKTNDFIRIGERLKPRQS